MIASLTVKKKPAPFGAQRHYVKPVGGQQRCEPRKFLADGTLRTLDVRLAAGVVLADGGISIRARRHARGAVHGGDAGGRTKKNGVE